MKYEIEDFEFEDAIMKLINKEKLLDFVLCYCNMLKIDEEPHQVATDILVIYAMHEMNKKGIKEVEDTQIAEEVYKLRFQYTVANLVKKGYVDVDMTDGKVKYSVTDKAKKLIKNGSVGQRGEPS